MLFPELMEIGQFYFHIKVMLISPCHSVSAFWNWDNASACDWLDTDKLVRHRQVHCWSGNYSAKGRISGVLFNVWI